LYTLQGAGKTSAVAFALNNKPGVLYLGVTETDTSSSLLVRLLDSRRSVLEENTEIESLYPVLLQAAEKMGGRRVTVVFEVERGTSSEKVLYMLKSTAKKLAVVANVIVVLSEANSFLMLRDDPRQQFIWVDGMLESEATACAKKIYPEISSDDLKLFINEVHIPFNFMYLLDSYFRVGRHSSTSN